MFDANTSREVITINAASEIPYRSRIGIRTGAISPT